MLHKIRFSLVAALVLLAMFLVPQVTMAASLNSIASAHAGVKSHELYSDSNSHWKHHPRHRHIIIRVHIKCRFFSCNIHSFNGNYIEIGKKKEADCVSGAYVNFTAVSATGESHTIRIVGNPAIPGTAQIFIDGFSTPVSGTIGADGVITFPAQPALDGASSLTLSASGIVLAGFTIPQSSIAFGCA